jgi:hypothetical protein
MGESEKSLPRHDVKAFDCTALSFMKRLSHMTETLGEFRQICIYFSITLALSNSLTNIQLFTVYIY